MRRHQRLSASIDNAICQQALLFRVAWSAVALDVAAEEFLRPVEGLSVDNRLVQPGPKFGRVESNPPLGSALPTCLGVRQRHQLALRQGVEDHVGAPVGDQEVLHFAHE